jgi:tRNA G46 methylase TrmB
MDGWNANVYDWKDLSGDGKLHSASFDRNHEAIFAELKSVFLESKNVLEIGSGTGEHMKLWAETFPLIQFHPTEHSELGRRAIAKNCESLQNVCLPAVECDLLDAPTPKEGIDTVVVRSRKVAVWNF